MSEIVGHVAQAEYPDSIYIVRKPESDLLLGDILKIRDRITGREYLVRVYNAYHGLTSISERLASLATKVPEVASTIKSEHFYDVYVASPLCIIERDAKRGAVKAFPTKTLPTQLSPVCIPDIHDFDFLKDLEGFDLPLGFLRTRTTSGERNLSICLKGEFIPRHIGVYAITGKGKCLRGDVPVLVRCNGRIFARQIGELVEEAFRTSNFQFNGGDATLTIENPKKYEALSFNPETLKMEWKQIVAFTKRHSSTLYKVTMASGRFTITTPDHAFLVLEKGRVIPKAGAKLKTSDYLPVPRLIPPPENPVTKVDALDLLKGERFYVISNESLHEAVNLLGFETALSLLEKNVTRNVRSRLRYYLSGHRVPIKYYHKLCQHQAILIEGKCCKDKIVAANGKWGIPTSIPLTDEFMRLCGYYVSEGAISTGKRSVHIWNVDQDIRSDITKCFEEGFSQRPISPPSDQMRLQVDNKPLAVLLASLFGPSKGDLSLLYSVDDDALAAFMKAYFSGDGTVYLNHNNPEISSSSKSLSLSMHLVTLLLRFGIVARVCKKSIKGEKYYETRIQGLEHVRKFATFIGFHDSVKQSTLTTHLNKQKGILARTNVDVIPSVSWILNKLKEKSGLSLCKLFGHRQSLVSMYLHEKRRPTRRTLQEIVTKLNGMKLVFEEVRILERLSSSDLFWDKIKNIKKLSGDYVYDVQVDGNGIFCGCYGGGFVHNTNAVLILLLSLLKSEGNYSALVFDAHNEYYFGSGKLRGLKEVEGKFRGRIKRYDLKEKYAPKISPHNVTPGLFRYMMELSEAQYEACLAYYRKGGENWILNILSETDAIQRGDISTPTITGVRPNTLLALARKLDLVLDGVVVYRQKVENDLVKAVLDELDGKCLVIVNLQDLSDIQEKIVTNILSESLLDERRALQNRDPRELGRKPIVLVVLEEALSVLSQSILRKGDNVFAHIVREGRKFRVGLLPVVQIPRRLDEDVASQINTNIILGTAQQADRAFIAESAQQDLATLINEMKMLDIGEALISFPAEVPFPLPVKIFHFNEYAETISEVPSITPTRKEVKTSKTEVDVAPPSL